MLRHTSFGKKDCLVFSDLVHTRIFPSPPFTFMKKYSVICSNNYKNCSVNLSFCSGEVWTSALLLQGLLENEYIGTSFAVGQVRSLSGYQALQNAYDISSDSNSKWGNLLILFLMAVGYRVLVFILLQFRVRKTLSCLSCCKQNTNNPR